MPEETYEHRGKPLNRPIIRAIRKCLVDRDVHRAINWQQKSLTVLEFKAKIQQYHQRNRRRASAVKGSVPTAIANYVN